MKRYIKSFTTDQLKQQLGDNYPEGGYLYIFKHGIGPGTIPRDVQIVKTKDLPNGYTAVWLDRFLTTSELKEYDIPDETRINELLERIGYCQKNGNVVPCDNIEACDKVTASTKPHPPIPEGWGRVPEGDDDDGNWGTIAKALPDNQGYYWINVIEDEKGRRCFELEVGYRGDDGAIGQIWKAASKPFYHLGDIVKYAENKMRREYDEDIDACDKVEATTEPKYFANMVSASADEDGFEQLVDVDENDSTWKEPVYYQAYSYYGSDYRGLEDDIATPDTSVLMDWIWEHAAHGGYIEVCGPKGCIKLDPDDLEEQVSNGSIDEYDIINQIDY